MASIVASRPVQRLTPRHIYKTVRERGSCWLKTHLLYADPHLIVLNKPPNVVCQVHHNWSRTEIKDDLNPVFRDIKACLPSRWKPLQVHRLDKGTTGCLLVALNPAAATSLSQQFRQRTVYKSYLALVRGGEKSFPEKSGGITDSLIYEDGRGRLCTNGLDPDQKTAITEWELLASSPEVPISLVKLKLLTGSKHQLRIHLALSMKTPILGDTLYSASPVADSITCLTEVPEDRIFLHASEISLFYVADLEQRYTPNGRQFRLGVRSPLPPDFQRICLDVGIVPPNDIDKKALLVPEDKLSRYPELHELGLWDQSL
ncbi:unnamed protein product [Cyclocybe aegerita]|uniref:Pseudouridine synthase RsuA/RluA-like domain-containing protein n=1 Tax=Cyclocybe aegerita TaxID=1973307 RepID=A0A8S0W4Y9_CYCAE|nr:unnamed protein product [Cyclocybe aegerita]